MPDVHRELWPRRRGGSCGQHCVDWQGWLSVSSLVEGRRVLVHRQSSGYSGTAATGSLRCESHTQQSIVVRESVAKPCLLFQITGQQACSRLYYFFSLSTDGAIILYSRRYSYLSRSMGKPIPPTTALPVPYMFLFSA
ncbi:unnamed protein product, partial [Ascophyllum nodosum]